MKSTPELTACWRCGKEVLPTATRCAVCAAALSISPGSPGRETKNKAETSPVVKLIGVFSVLLLTSLVQGFSFDVEDAVIDSFLESALYQSLVVEGVDTVIVLFALFWVSLPPPLVRPARPVRLASWIVGIPLLGGLLILNFAYHAALSRWAGTTATEEELTADPGLLGLVIVVYCLQPAVVEELFFRFLALGTLRRVVGDHGAVLLSAVMFGLCHIGSPLSIPILTVIGIGLGYARVASGGLALPMIMHFCHNAVVLWVDHTP